MAGWPPQVVVVGCDSRQVWPKNAGVFIFEVHSFNVVGPCRLFFFYPFSVPKLLLFEAFWEQTKIGENQLKTA